MIAVPAMQIFLLPSVSMAVTSIFDELSRFGQSVNVDDKNPSQVVSQLVDNIIRGLWQQIGNSNLYAGMLAVGKVILGIGLFIILYKTYYELTENSQVDIRRVVLAFIWPIIAITLLLEVPQLGQSAIRTGDTNLWNISVAIKAAIDNLDKAAISGIVGDKNPIVELTKIQNAYQSVVTAINECKQNPDIKAREQCIESVAQALQNDPRVPNDIKQLAQELLQNRPPTDSENSRQDPNDPNSITEFNSNPFTRLGSQSSQVLIQGLFIAIYFMFEIVLELSILLMAVVAPIAVGMSLIPLRVGTVGTWLSGIVALGLTKISFHLLATMSSYFANQVNYGGMNTVVFMLLGVASPFIAGSVGTFSAAGIQSGIAYMTGLFISLSATPILKSLGLLNLLMKRGK